MRLFVYGTLMRGGVYHHLISHCAFLAEAHTREGYTLIDLGDYPAMLEDGNTSVAGELYEVDDTTLDALDVLEGHPDYYRRAEVEMEDGSLVISYVFVDHGALGRATPIATGQWIHKHRR